MTIKPNQAESGARRNSRHAVLIRLRRTMIGWCSAEAVVALFMPLSSFPPLPRMQQARIGDDRHDIGRQIQKDVGCRKDQRAALYHRYVFAEHGIDHELADAGIDENDLHNYDTDNEIGEIDRDDVG